MLEINSNILISKDEEYIIIWKNNKVAKKLKLLDKVEMFKVNNYLILVSSLIIFLDIKKNFEEVSKIKVNIINPIMLNQKIMIGGDNKNSLFILIDIEERKVIKRNQYEPDKIFILRNLCKKWAFELNLKNNSKLIRIDLIQEDNKYDVICDNEESLIIESSGFLTNLFDEFFITCKDEKISCYGCF